MVISNISALFLKIVYTLHKTLLLLILVIFEYLLEVEVLTEMEVMMD